MVGLNALKRDLVKAAADRGVVNAAFSKAGTQAMQPIAGAVRGSLPHGTGRLAGDVRVSATRSGGSLRVGRASVRYAGFVDFGGRRRAPHESSRDYTPNGRYLFPAARRLAGEASQLYTDALQQAIDAIAWTNSTNDGGAVHD
jgi:hypothetical protein